MHGRIARIVNVRRLLSQGSNSRWRPSDDWDSFRERAESDRERAEIDAIFLAHTETTCPCDEIDDPVRGDRPRPGLLSIEERDQADVITLGPRDQAGY